MTDLAATRRPGGGFCARTVPAGAAGSCLVPTTMMPKWSGITIRASSATVLPIRVGTRGWAPSQAWRSATAAGAKAAVPIATAATAIHPLPRGANPLPRTVGGAGDIGS